MSEITQGGAFLFIWIGFLLLVTTGISCILVWAVRAGQFRDQDRARYLALESCIPDPEHEVSKK